MAESFGMNIYDLEDEMGLYEEDPAAMGNKYALMQEYPSQDIVARNKAAEDAKKEGKEGATLVEGAPTPEKEGEEAQPDANAGDVNAQYMEKFQKLNAEFDMIVADGMWDMSYDFVMKAIQFKGEAEAAGALEAVDQTLNLLNKTARILFMGPETKFLNAELKLYLVQDLIIPAMPTLTMQMERIWQFMIEKKSAALEKGGAEEEEEEEDY